MAVRIVRRAALAGALALAGLSAAPSPAHALGAPVGLGTAGTYSVLGGQTVTNTGPSTLSGDLGVSPGSAITGFPPGVIGGTKHAADAQALQAQSDLAVAYNDAAGRAPTASVAGDLVGQTLPSGVYKSTGPLALSGTLTLDGQGDPNAVFIFQIASTLITAAASNVNVTLINGAKACNVFWQVGSSATLGTTSSFKGTILALTSITVAMGTVVEGRALARNAQVSLDTNTFTTATCAASTTTTTSTTAPTTATTPPTTSKAAPTTAPTTPTTSGTTGRTGATGPGGAASGPDGGGAGAGGAGLDDASNPTATPVGSGQLAFTGASPNSGPLLALGSLLIALGGVILAVERARDRSRTQPEGRAS